MKYIVKPSRPSSYYHDEYEGSVTADQIIEDDYLDEVDIGLVDMHGAPLYRVRDRIPFGFVLQK